MMPSRSPLLLFVLALLLAACVVCWADEPSPVQAAYDNIKGIEAATNSMFPSPYGETTIGTFDAATGYWDGLASAEVNYIPAPGKPERTRIVIPNAHVNAVLVGLVFRVTNREGEFSIRINNGVKHRAPGGQDFVVVRVGRATQVKWTAECRGKTYSDTVNIVRPPQIGAGAFTIPALPITIIYDPPQDRNKQNTASYEETASLGTTSSATFSSDESTTRNVTSEFALTTDLGSKITTLADGVGKIKSPYTAIISGALKLFAGGLGSSSSTQTNGHIDVKDHQLVLKVTKSELTQTTTHLGPGLGDLFILLRNPRLVWLCDKGDISLALLGWDREQTVLAKTLREDLDGYAKAAARRDAMGGLRRRSIAPTTTPSTSPGPSATGPTMTPTPRPGANPPGGVKPRPIAIYTPKSGLDEETIKSLVKLDPFIAGGPDPNLSRRFVWVEQYEINGGYKRVRASHEIVSTDTNTATDYQTWVDDYNAGWLSAIGIGPSETKKVKSNFSQSSSKAVTEGFEAAAQVEFWAEADEDYIVTVYYDTTFGSFAFRQEAGGGESVVSGTATGANGQPAANQMVTITAGGRRFTTFADRSGNYVFHSREIPNGPATLSVGATRKPISVTRGKAVAPVAPVKRPGRLVLPRLPR
jgi:hypothetical protein